jgi:hypothetical protein
VGTLRRLPAFSGRAHAGLPASLSREGAPLVRPAPAPDTLGRVSDEAQERAVLLEERALQAAMLASDGGELDRLLHPSLLASGQTAR